MKKLSMTELNRLSVEEFKVIEKFQYVLVLDSVRSMNNVGSVFRTADAFMASKVYLCGITATPPHRDITKTALGADLSVNWEYAQNCATLCLKLKEEGYVIMAVEQVEKAVMLNDFEPVVDQKYAFVLGNEIVGVSQEVIEIADYCLEIPQFGTKHSLNIAVTTGVVAWDFISKVSLIKPS